LFANELLPKSVFRLVTIRGQLSHDLRKGTGRFYSTCKVP